MEQSVIRIGKRKIAVSNLEKILYPGGRFTKADVIGYYSQVAPILLPHFKNRPVTLVRYPDGVFKESFYEKNAPGFTPSWVKTFPVPRQNGGVINYILINDIATLVWAANLAALELHPFLHRAPNIARPTHIVFDLDPGEGADILTCAEVALLVRDLLTGLKLKAFPKVSGSKGIQVYVPLNTPNSYEATQAFARALADLLVRQHPHLVVAEMSKALRSGKVFIDWSQNYPTKTTVGVYSLRAKHPRPFVSMPVTWEELNQALRTKSTEALYFSPDAALARLKKLGDLFAPTLKLKQRIPEMFVESLPKATSARHLEPYAAKRDFSRTTEPEPVPPQRSAQGSQRRFVVQKHAAQHLHYDFRLEMHDVLKSWAVPKGVPLQDGERHHAFATEDHPLDYLEFEGIIPKDQYGGGTVMVWDIGTYNRVAGNYYAGELKVFLSGRKLKGEWSLKRITRNANSDGRQVWILTKTGGRARHIKNSQSELSALTGKSLEQIARQPSAVWQSDRAKPAADAQNNRPPSRSKRHRSESPPKFVPPMKATLVDSLPRAPQWIYEIKWDGYRALAAKHDDAVRLLSLKNKNLAADFPSVVAAISTLQADSALLDGEIVAVNEQGLPSFQALQNRATPGRLWQILYYAFDLLSIEGKDLRHLPLEQRRARLKELVEGSDVRFSAGLEGTVDKIVETVKRAGLEGIVAKDRNSAYHARTRTPAWRKFKLSLSQEFVIGGYNPAGNTFSSLLVGYYKEKTLMFAGKVRQGLSPLARASLVKLLNRHRIRKCPFANLPISKTGHFGEGITSEDMAKLHWTKPLLVAQVSFTEWTSYGLLRHATFHGLRKDKDPTEVVKECPATRLPRG